YACNTAASFARAFPTSGLLDIAVKSKSYGNELEVDTPFRLTSKRPARTYQSRRRSHVSPAPEPEVADPTSDWTLLGSQITDGLAELQLHSPRPGNMPGTFYVDATLRIMTGLYDYKDRTVAIGVKDAFLSLESQSYQPAKNSMIGIRAAHPNSQPDIGGVKIKSPVDEWDCLCGDPLGEDYVAVIEPAGEGELPVTVSLHAGRLSFDVRSADAVDGRADEIS